MSFFEGLEPKCVFDYFDILCRIPRGSGNEQAISDYLCDFAREHNLKAVQDHALNVVIYKEATKGYENKDTIIMQAHMDMVNVSNDEAPGDMDKIGVTAYVDGDYICAKGTTLGGDDGIGVAMILAILDSKDIPHPAIEAVFTTGEEVGLDGAKALDFSMLSGKKLINIDSEVENELVIGCAGGCVCNISYDYPEESISGTKVTISVAGASGGHSGIEIHRGLMSANVMMGRLLYEIADVVDYSLISTYGGQKDNAICTSAYADIVVSPEDIDAIKEVIEEYNKYTKVAYKRTDQDVNISIEVSGEGKYLVMNDEAFHDYLTFINCAPHGMVKMSQIKDKMVESSSNIGIVKIAAGKALICISVRSNLDKDIDWQKKKLSLLARSIGADISYTGEYPAWESKEVSEFAKFVANKYRELFNKEINIVTIHAGLECALFYAKQPEIEAISIGPDILDIHSPSERLSISSVVREWTLIKEILKV